MSRGIRCKRTIQEGIHTGFRLKDMRIIFRREAFTHKAIVDPNKLIDNSAVFSELAAIFDRGFFLRKVKSKA